MLSPQAEVEAPQLRPLGTPGRGEPDSSRHGRAVPVERKLCTRAMPTGTNLS